MMEFATQSESLENLFSCVKQQPEAGLELVDHSVKIQIFLGLQLTWLATLRAKLIAQNWI